MQFEVHGNFKEKGKNKTFKKTVEATSEHRALEIVLSNLGSEQQAKRKDIVVHEVKTVA